MLRVPESGDADEFIALSRSSREFHRGLANPPDDDESFRRYLAKNELNSDRCFLICRLEDEALLGAVNLSQIFYGGFKNAYLGYYLFQQFAGQGFMTEALRLVLRFAFNELALHRVEANIQPHNSDSIALVKRLGFVREGYSRKYLKIGGKWRDHERWAIIREDFRTVTKK